MNKESVIAALEAAVPGLRLAPDALDRMPQAEDERIYWFDELLTTSFCCYVEWKNFSSIGFKSVKKMTAIRNAGVELSIDALFDENGEPILSDDIEDDLDFDPGEFFLSPLNEQLRPAKLQLLELCALEDGSAYGAENPRLVCATTDSAVLKRANEALKPLGFALL